MSITTGRGDQGETDLLFGRRVPKTSLRVAVLGAIDELNAALGLVRTAQPSAALDETVDVIQERLISLMGQLGILPEDAVRYAEKGYGRIEMAEVEWIEERVRGLERDGLRFRGWARPGAGAPAVSAHLEFARVLARRAEREVWRLHETDGPVPATATLFLNRLSDLLWLLAREAALGAE